MQMPGIEEETPLCHPSTLAPSRPPPLSQPTATSHEIPSTTGVPSTCGAASTPLRRSDPTRVERAVGEPEPSPNYTPPPIPEGPDPARFTATAHKGRRQALRTTLYTIRGHSVALLLDEEFSECYLLTWKTQRKTRRQGRALDCKYVNGDERAAFREASATEWESLLGTGAIEIIIPPEASKVPTERILSRPMRNALTNKPKEELAY